MKHISLVQQILLERQKTAAVIARNKKNTADIDYIAMMCDVELEALEDDGVSDNDEEV